MLDKASDMLNSGTNYLKNTAYKAKDYAKVKYDELTDKGNNKNIQSNNMNDFKETKIISDKGSSKLTQ